MYTNAGYLDRSETDLEDLSVPLRINSCGVYRMEKRPLFYTMRPLGRADYQLLYIAYGKAYFTYSEEEIEVSAGHMVLYRPGQAQKYSYHAKNRTEVYWIHFTGSQVDPVLSQTGFENYPILYTGIFSEYQTLFTEIIRELQMNRTCFKELMPLYLQQLLLLIRRRMLEGPGEQSRMRQEIERAAEYFNENYTQPLEIEAYAKNQHMSICWFIRSFKHYMGMTPLKYLTAIRINRAKELLEGSDYTITEISDMIGYENPLYFSRVFKNATGHPPREYRQRTAQ